ncbi:MAG: hypothetical protein ACP5I7_00305 [Sulfolobales archaeon]
MFFGEERENVILGLDLSTIPVIKKLCEIGERNILVIEDSVEPGAYTGTYYSSGFVVEKMYIIFSRDEKFLLDELGFETICLRPRLRIAKPGDLFSKISCWKKDLVPWWIPSEFSEICFMKEPGKIIKERILGGCAEYTFYSPRKIDPLRKIIVLRNGRVIKYRNLIVAYPINRFFDRISSKDLREKYINEILKLKWIGLLSISYGIRGREPNWDIILHATKASRTHIFITVSSMLRHTAPQNHYLINIQMSYCEDYPPPPDAISRGVAEIRWAGLLDSEENIVLERIFVLHHMIPYGADPKVLRELKDTLSNLNIYLLGIRGEGLSMGLRDQINRHTSLQGIIDP